jgi:hypothetical protein
MERIMQTKSAVRDTDFPTSAEADNPVAVRPARAPGGGGISLLEVALALGIGCVMIGGAVSFYQTASEAQARNQRLEAVYRAAGACRAAYPWAGPTVDPDCAALSEAEATPPSELEKKMPELARAADRVTAEGWMPSPPAAPYMAPYMARFPSAAPADGASADARTFSAAPKGKSTTTIR